MRPNCFWLAFLFITAFVMVFEKSNAHQSNLFWRCPWQFKSHFHSPPNDISLCPKWNLCKSSCVPCQKRNYFLGLRKLGSVLLDLLCINYLMIRRIFEHQYTISTFELKILQLRKETREFSDSYHRKRKSIFDYNSIGIRFKRWIFGGLSIKIWLDQNRSWIERLFLPFYLILFIFLERISTNRKSWLKLVVWWQSFQKLIGFQI